MASDTSDLGEMKVVETNDVNSGIDLATAVFEPKSERDLSIDMATQSDSANASDTDTTTSGNPNTNKNFKYIDDKVDVYYGKTDPSLNVGQHYLDQKKKDEILAKARKSKEAIEKESQEKSERE